MNLYDFEDEVSSVIVERGFDYYQAGFVAKLLHLGDGKFTARVEGADMYEVAVDLDTEFNILSSYCDCSFDIGPTCKHVVAVFFELVDGLKGNRISEVTVAIANSDQPDMKSILENLSKDKLIELLMDLANNDRTLHNRLLFNYASVDEQQEIIRCKRLIESINEKYINKEGFITYKYVGDYAKELSGVLTKIDTLQEPLIAIEIAGMVLIEGMKSIQHVADSNGDMRDLIEKTIETMQTIVDGSLENAEQKELLSKLIHLSKSDVLEEWADIRIDVLAICLGFAANEQLRNTLTTELESMIDDSSVNHYGRYANERILNLLYDIIETHGTTEEARQFLHENINYPSFRKRLMQYEMKEGNYESVLSLASEGERMDKDYLGLEKRWKKWRYRAYKQLNSYEEQMKIGREMIIEGDFEYYWELKELAANDHLSFYEELKLELSELNHLMYVQLIEAENDIDAILDYVRENPSSVERYSKLLLDTYKEDTIRLFKQHIQKLAQDAFIRNQYKEVCQVLKSFRKTAGREAQMDLIEELKMIHKNRPAFLNELGKL